MFRRFHLIALCVVGCAPKAVAPSAEKDDAVASKAMIVFVWPASACDNGDRARIVDESGHFVGELGRGTTAAIPVEPMWYAGSTPTGAIFYVWPAVTREPRTPGNIGFEPVSFVQIHPKVRGITYEGVFPTFCGQSVRFHFASPTPANTATWLRGARPSTLDPKDGQALLERDADTTRDYLTRGRDLRATIERIGRELDTTGAPF